MAWGLLKSVAVGGTATAAAGGGIAASSMLSSNSEKEPSPITKSSSSMEEVAPAQESLPTPKPTCVIYEAEQPKTQGNSRKFEKLLKKFKNQGEFYKEFKDRAPISEESTKDEISRMCSSDGKHINNNIYVWYGSGSQGKATWIYASDLNGKVDWVTSGDVVKQFQN